MNKTESDVCQVIAKVFGLFPQKPMEWLSLATEAVCDTKDEMDRLYKETRGQCFNLAKKTGVYDARKNPPLQTSLEKLATYWSLNPGSTRSFIRVYLKDSGGKWKPFDWKRVPESPGWYD